MTTTAEIPAALIEPQYPPGSLTIWHPMATPPHHPGTYQIQRVGSLNSIRTGKVASEYRHWDGKGWGILPWAYVSAWRGVVR